jgi:hypothetical protein
MIIYTNHELFRIVCYMFTNNETTDSVRRYNSFLFHGKVEYIASVRLIVAKGISESK